MELLLINRMVRTSEHDFPRPSVYKRRLPSRFVLAKMDDQELWWVVRSRRVSGRLLFVHHYSKGGYDEIASGGNPTRADLFDPLSERIDKLFHVEGLGLLLHKSRTVVIVNDDLDRAWLLGHKASKRAANSRDNPFVIHFNHACHTAWAQGLACGLDEQERTIDANKVFNCRRPQEVPAFTRT